MKKPETRVPIMFQKINHYESNSDDSRFTKVKIWIMHTGQNHNGSYFSKEVVKDAIPTLANTPILAYIEDNSKGEKDFSDHRQIIVIEDGDVKIKYIGQAIGVIPEENDAHFEFRLCDDGVEREFLVCEGIVWNKWDDPIDIFNRDQVKANSMELHEEYSGEFQQDNLFHFTEFKFFGACSLGEDVLPAMQNSTIEKQFSFEEMYKDIQNNMEEFKRLYTRNHKGGNHVDDKEKLLEKYSLTKNDLEEKKINIKDYSLEDLEAELKKLKDNKKDYELTAKQLRQEIRAELYKEKEQDMWGFEWSRYWYVDHNDSLVIAEDDENASRLVGFSYSVDNNAVKIDFDSKTRVAISYEPFEGNEDLDFEIKSKDKTDYDLKVKEKELEKSFTTEKEEAVKGVQSDLDDIKDKYSKIEEEAKELREFKHNKLATERQEAENELFEQFSNDLSDEDISEIKEKASEYSIEDLENKLYALVGKKKANFSQTKTKKSVKIGVDNHEDENKSNKSYAHLFDKYSKQK